MAGISPKAFAILFLTALFVALASAQRYGGGAPAPPYGSNGNYSGRGLRFQFYRRTCPQAEILVSNVVTAACQADRTLVASIIRLFFHDCFVNGCDASVLLDGPDSEKLGAPNANSLRGFEVIDQAKAAVERACPRTVSCADVLAFAARDAMLVGGSRFPFGLWLAGRKDGDVSSSSQTLVDLPAPFLDEAGLKAAFARKGLSEREMVILSGAHTVGRAHCAVILARIYNFKGTGQADPSINTAYLAQLRGLCPSTAPGTLINMDLITPLVLDTQYYTDVLNGRGLFESDNALRTTPQTTATSRSLTNPRVFNQAFILGMLKMGQIEVKTGNAGKIHVNCRSTN